MPYPDNFSTAYPPAKRYRYTLVTVLVAILIAGFWHPGVVDGFGRDVVAGSTIGDTNALAGEFENRGSLFGIIFAAIAGLAATFTACNCVVFAMIPGMTCSTATRTGANPAWQALYAFTVSVLLVSAVYGLYIGFLGPVGIDYINQTEVRRAQSFAVFTTLGLVMVFWGMLELGFLDRIKNYSSEITRAFLGQITVKAGILGTMVGLFTVGRPYPVFRNFLEYAASAQSPAYGALVMMIQGLGQIAVMVALFLLLVKFAGNRIGAISLSTPYKFQIINGLALLGGGVYFLYYWGLGRLFDAARWGFKLGWYN